jgi:hypothetical protein
MVSILTIPAANRFRSSGVVRGRIHSAGERAVSEAGGQRLSGGYRSDGADQCAFGIEDQCVTAVEHGQGGECVETRVQGADTDSGTAQSALD